MSEEIEIIPYDFSRYVLVTNWNNRLPRDVLVSVDEGVPYRLIQNDLNWALIIKYPNRKAAIKYGNFLHRDSDHYTEIGVQMVIHILSSFSHIESSEEGNFEKAPTYVRIRNLPLKITPIKWKTLLSKFGTAKVVKHSLREDLGIYLIVEYKTMAEATGAILALHMHDVRGKKLLVELHRGEKEDYLLDAFASLNSTCSCLTYNCILHSLPDGTSEEISEHSNEEEIKLPPKRPLICTFCHHPNQHPKDDDYDANRDDAAFNEDNVPWEKEFPELTNECSSDEDFDEQRLEDNWEVINLIDFKNSSKEKKKSSGLLFRRDESRKATSSRKSFRKGESKGPMFSGKSSLRKERREPKLSDKSCHSGEIGCTNRIEKWNSAFSDDFYQKARGSQCLVMNASKKRKVDSRYLVWNILQNKKAKNKYLGKKINGESGEQIFSEESSSKEVENKYLVRNPPKKKENKYLVMNPPQKK